MGRLKEPEKGLVFTAIFSKDQPLIKEVSLALSNFYKSRILLSSEIFLFNHTNYYEKEMGSNLKKQIFLYDYLIDTSLISDIKIKTNELEEKFSEGKSLRMVNIDPGYITLSKVCLATTKNYSHRIYIGKSIYVEVTLNYRSGSFITNPWTYPDYKEKKVIEFFNKARHFLKQRQKF